MSTQEVLVHELFKLYHHSRKTLSPKSEQRGESLNSVAQEDRNRLIAAGRLAILALEINARLQDEPQRYFAKPGEAEWGC